MKTLVAVGKAGNGTQYTMEVTHAFPLSAEWFAKNSAAVVR